MLACALLGQTFGLQLLTRGPEQDLADKRRSNDLGAAVLAPQQPFRSGRVVNNNMPTNTAMAAASDKNTVRITR